jgi:flagellar protein FliO/FliZ
MLTPVVFLPLAAVLINDVKAEARDGEVTVEIATSDPVAASDVRVASGGGRRFYVYLDGSAAKQMSFGEGIVVHPRLRYTKLEIPTTDRCGEPAGVTATQNGVRVRATCRGASSSHEALSPSLGLPVALHAEHPSPEAPQAALVRDKQRKLRAALALPPEAGGEGAAAGPAVEEAPKPATVPPSAKPVQPEKAGVSGKTEAPPQGKAAEEPRPAKPSPPEARAAATDDKSGVAGSGEAKSGSSAAATVAGVAVLLVLGAAGVFFARRRGRRERMIRILETASIGPRRSLVVACVGSRTMVLGVSEAGVSLLDAPVVQDHTVDGTRATAKGAVEDAALGLRNLALAAGFAAEGTPTEAKNESSLLGRLFHRKPREAEGLERQDFEELFAESLEDEELRRKLALGQAGRIA